MKTLVTLLLLGLAVPFSRTTIAQTQKTHQYENAEGVTVESPYITYSEFKNISIDGKARLGELLTLNSTDEVTHALGEPKEKNVLEIGAGGIEKEVTFVYKGFSIEYLKKNGKLLLEILEIVSNNKFIKLNGFNIKPGMSINKLSNSIYINYKISKNRYSNQSTSIKVSRENTSTVELISGTTIVMEINDSKNYVEMMRIERMVI